MLVDMIVPWAVGMELRNHQEKLLIGVIELDFNQKRADHWNVKKHSFLVILVYSSTNSTFPFGIEQLMNTYSELI